jgi:hypothetical protein
LKWTPTVAAAVLLLGCAEESEPDGLAFPTRPAAERSALSSSGPPGGDAATRLLPDLRVSEPQELYIQAGADGIREIRFSTTIQNAGDGPLLILGDYDENSDAVSTVQQIQHTDATIEEYHVGRFVFDDGHEHWHLEDFIVFELWSLAEDGSPAEIIATTGKMTFCLADSHPMEELPPNAAAQAKVTSCEQTVQGISVGWEDIYLSELPGQELDIGELQDGRYAIRSVVDPDNLILETDNGNNATTSVVEIAGDTISYVG